ncbi:hypothetical protein CYLTODRAFT_78655 [Cylindrobasidium torrendii FP15055 ss-10]|uniref:Uncharacterized protein n=1 Tax=Cylindrobasidium torrendii FP15055 ss-10 TaxID=1314674 RepID=A0A0D7BP28_9AGAR|nr:hypothetical protein CYLTODRAFT_78655 [Cylindrobasidium torrendii FP15055 ss-10]
MHTRRDTRRLSWTTRWSVMALTPATATRSALLFPLSPVVLWDINLRRRLRHSNRYWTGAHWQHSMDGQRQAGTIHLGAHIRSSQCTKRTYSSYPYFRLGLLLVNTRTGYVCNCTL